MACCPFEISIFSGDLPIGGSSSFWNAPGSGIRVSIKGRRFRAFSETFSSSFGSSFEAVLERCCSELLLPFFSPFPSSLTSWAASALAFSLELLRSFFLSLPFSLEVGFPSAFFREAGSFSSLASGGLSFCPFSELLFSWLSEAGSLGPSSERSGFGSFFAPFEALELAFSCFSFASEGVSPLPEAFLLPASSFSAGAERDGAFFPFSEGASGSLVELSPSFLSSFS